MVFEHWSQIQMASPKCMTTYTTSYNKQYQQHCMVERAPCSEIARNAILSVFTIFPPNKRPTHWLPGLSSCCCDVWFLLHFLFDLISYATLDLLFRNIALGP